MWANAFYIFIHMACAYRNESLPIIYAVEYMHTTRTHPLQYRQNDSDSAPKADVSSQVFNFVNRPRAAFSVSTWHVKGLAQIYLGSWVHPKTKMFSPSHTVFNGMRGNWPRISSSLKRLEFQPSDRTKVWGNCYPLLHDAWSSHKVRIHACTY